MGGSSFFEAAPLLPNGCGCPLGFLERHKSRLIYWLSQVTRLEKAAQRRLTHIGFGSFPLPSAAPDDFFFHSHPPSV